MRLQDFFSTSRVDLHLPGDSRDEVLNALLALLELDERSRTILSRTLRRRENLGSTGIGRGIAIPIAVLSWSAGCIWPTDGTWKGWTLGPSTADPLIISS